MVGLQIFADKNHLHAADIISEHAVELIVQKISPNLVMRSGGTRVLVSLSSGNLNFTAEQHR